MRLTPESRGTLVRFGCTIATVAAVGGGAWCAGLPAGALTSLLCNYCSILALFLAGSTKDLRVSAHLNRVDEAAWFYLVGHVLRAHALG